LRISKKNSNKEEGEKLDKPIPIVVIVPVIKIENNTYFILEYQYRPKIGKWIFELPAGHVNESERLEDAVRREMEEETGLKPKTVRPMFNYGIYITPATNKKILYYYVAEDFSNGKAHPDADEDIKVIGVKIKDALNIIIKPNPTVKIKDVPVVKIEDILNIIKPNSVVKLEGVPVVKLKDALNITKSNFRWKSDLKTLFGIQYSYYNFFQNNNMNKEKYLTYTYE